MKKLIRLFRLDFSGWLNKHIFQVYLLNLFLIMLFLLRSVGYFKPYFTLSINFIIMFSLVASIFLLGANTATFLVTSLLFWLFSGILRSLGIEVWADRSAIYTFQSLFIGFLLLIYELVAGSFSDKHV